MANTKTFEAKINLKSGGPPVPVRVEARNVQEARRMIEAQYSGQIKSFSHSPKKV